MGANCCVGLRCDNNKCTIEQPAARVGCVNLMMTPPRAIIAPGMIKSWTLLDGSIMRHMIQQVLVVLLLDCFVILAQTLAKDRMMSRELFITLYITVVLLVLIVMNVFIVFVVVALTNTEPMRYALLMVIAQIKKTQMFLLVNEVNTTALMFVCTKTGNVE